MKDDNVKPCVQCGYCCRIRPCQWSFRCSNTGAFGGICVHLSVDSASNLRTYTCDIWDKIKYMEKGSPYPMCGSGCSSTLFNTMRDRVIQVMKEMAVERMTR